MIDYYFNMYFKTNKIEFKKHYFNNYLKEYFKKIQEDKTNQLKDLLKKEESNYDLKELELERAITENKLAKVNLTIKNGPPRSRSIIWST